MVVRTLDTRKEGGLVNAEPASPTPGNADASKDIREACVWRDALMHDPWAGVVVVGSDGRIVASNAAFARRIEAPGPIVGRRIADLVPPDIGAERTALTQRVRDTGRPLVALGMVRGVYCSAVYRRCSPRGDHDDLLLGVCHPVTAHAGVPPIDFDAEVVDCGIQDWGRLASLSDRELEILDLIGEGLTTAEVAKALHRAEKTVEWHRSSLGDKLGGLNRVELARVARESGVAPFLRRRGLLE